MRLPVLALLGAAITALVAYRLTWVARRVALRAGIVATPGGVVKTHVEVTPLLGGAAILVALAPPLLLAMALDRRWTGLAVALPVVAALGLYKDVRVAPLSPLLQLPIQLGAAAIVVAGGFRAAGVALSIVLCVWLVNGWNFLDVMDGVAGSVAVVGGLAFFAIALRRGDLATAVVGAGLAGAACGFLLHNRPPARIFMGDVGSYGLGLVFAALALSAPRERDVVAAAVVLLLPLADPPFATAVRIAGGRSPLRAGPDHLALRLSRAGMSRRGVMMAMSAAAAVVGLAGMWVTP